MSGDADPEPVEAPTARQIVRIVGEAVVRDGAAALLRDVWATRPGRGRQERVHALADRMDARGEDPAGVHLIRDTADRQRRR